MNTKKRFPFYTAFIGTAIIALFSLTGCEYFVDPSRSTPAGSLVIAAFTQPISGANAISIVVSGGFFNSAATITDFTIGGTYASTGVSVGTGSTATQFNFALATSIAVSETITIQAKTTAFSPAASAASNTVTFTATTAPLNSVSATSTIAPAVGHNTITLTLTGGTFKAAPITAADFTGFTSDVPEWSATAFSAASFTRVSNTVVEITLPPAGTAGNATGTTVTIPGATQATQATSAALATSKVIPRNNITYKKVAAAPTTHSASNNATTAEIHITGTTITIDAAAVTTYATTDTNGPLLDALVSAMEADDVFAFTSGKISAITKGSTGTTPITLTLGASLSASDFATAVTLTGSSTTGFKLGSAWTVPTGSTITLAANTTFDLDAFDLTMTDGSLVLTAATGTGGAKFTGGTGKVVAGKTEIVGSTGGWQAVGASGTVTIAAASATASSITANATAAVLTAGAGATITQLSGAGNNLTIGASTTVDLATAGVLVLKAAATDGGKLTTGGATTTLGASGVITYTGTAVAVTGSAGALTMAGASAALVSAGITAISTTPTAFVSLESSGSSAGDITITGGQISAATTLQSTT